MKLLILFLGGRDMFYGVLGLLVVFVVARLLMSGRESGQETEQGEVPPDVENRLFYRLRNDSSESGTPMLTVARELLTAYWQPSPEEKAALLSQGIEDLEWNSLLRLHHLLCLEAVASEEGQRQIASQAFDDKDFPPGALLDHMKQVTARLLSADSPYRARNVTVSLEDDKGQIRGLLQNQSVTHFGCLEVVLANEQGLFERVDFIPMDEIFQVTFYSEGFNYNYVQIQLEFGEGEVEALVPKMYLLSSKFPPLYDPEREVTRYICSYSVDGQSFAVGVGKHDLGLRSEAGLKLLGVNAIESFETALSVHDHDFEERCRGRGMPSEVIEQLLANTPEANVGLG